MVLFRNLPFILVPSTHQEVYNLSEAELIAARIKVAKRFDIMTIAIQDLADALNAERIAVDKALKEKEDKIRELQVPVKSKEIKK